MDNEKRNASRIRLHSKPKSRGDEAINRHKIPKNINMDRMSLYKSQNRYGLSVQRKKIRAAVGNSMNSTKYNTISNDTPSVTLPNVNRSQKDINPLDIEDFKTNNDKLVKNMQGSQSRMSKAVDGIISVLQDSTDYSNINKVSKSPLGLNTLEAAHDKKGS